MNHPGDFDGVVPRDRQAELLQRLLDGDLPLRDVPIEQARLAGLLHAIRMPGEPVELSDEVKVVTAMSIAIQQAAPARIARPVELRSRRTQRMPRVRRALVPVAVAAAVLGASGAAAATGNLPAPAQTFVSDALSHVGVSVPTADAPAATEEPGSSVPSSTTGVPPSIVLPDPVGRTGAASSAAPSVAPGQTGATPGQSGSPPPGQAGTTPGQSAETPGQSATAPGQLGETPGQSGATPGQSGEESPEQSDTAPGGPGSTPGQSGEAPREAKK